MQSISLDPAATTPVLDEVLEAMRPHFRAANAASSHHAGRQARRALEDAREKTGALLHAHPDEVIFTSGATEANNLALFGLTAEPPGSVLASPIEHPSVLERLERLRQRGFQVEYLRVDAQGVVPAVELDRAAQLDPQLAVLMLVNHETGALQPVRELAKCAPVHCDAAAAAAKVPLDFHDLGATTLTLSAHKFHGPQGAGALLVRRRTKLRAILFG